ncbi:MAG TPA: serine acetyltransferase [Flavobacteriales bacterium]|nr:serine acetyltransferase [Flavobacteriales bacterium]
MRKLEYYKNCKRGFLAKLYAVVITRKFQKLSIKLGFSIPINVFGAGLSIAHYGTIIINTGARIGENCRIHAGVNIGTAAGFKDKAPVLGNNIYIGPGVKIYGDVRLASNIAISANAVVNQSFEEEGSVLAGIPAKQVSKTNVENLLIKGADIVRAGKNSMDLTGLTSREIKERVSS